MADDDVQVSIGAKTDDFDTNVRQSANVMEQSQQAIVDAANQARAAFQNLGTAAQKWADLTKTSAAEVGDALKSVTVDYRAVIEAATGLNQAGKSAAESAAFFEDMMGVTAQRAQALRSALTTVDGQFSAIGATAGHAGQSLGAFFGSSRIGMLELQAAGVNAFQALAAGISPLRVLETEGAQVFGALIQGGALTVSSLAAIGPAGWGALAGVTALGGGLLALAYDAAQARDALDGAQRSMILMGRTGSLDPQAVQQDIDHLKKLGDVSASTAEQIRNSFALIPTATDQTRKQLEELTIAFAGLTGSEPDKAADAIAKAFDGGASSLLAFGKQFNLFTSAQQESLLKAQATNDVYGAQAIGLDALNARLRAYLDYQQQSRDYNKMVQIYGAAGVEPPPELVQPKLPTFAPGQPGAAEDPAATQRQASVDKYLATDREIAAVEQDIANIKKVQSQATDDNTKAETASALTQAQQRLDALKQQQAGNGKQGGVDVVAQLKTELAQQGAATQQSLTAQLAAHVSFWNNVLSTQKLTAAQRTEIEAEVAADQKRLSQSSLRDEVAAIQARVGATREGSQQRVALLRQAADLQKAAYGAESAEYLGALSAVTAAVRQATDQQYRDKIAGMDREIAAAHEGSQERVNILKSEASLAAQVYGRQSNEYQAALRKMEDAERQHQAQLTQIKLEAVDARQQLDTLALDDQRAGYDQDVALGRLSNAQKIALLRQFEAQQYQIELQAQQQRIQLALQDPTQSPVQVQKLYQQLEVLNRQHQNRMNGIDRQAATDTKTQWQSILSPISNAFTGITQGILQGTQTWQQAVSNAAISVAASFIDAGEKWLSNYLLNLVIGETAQKAQATQQVTTNAAVAASGAYASSASTPGIGWIIAPAVAATALAAVLAFRNSFAVGTGNVPYDMAAQVHKGEIIVPRTMSDSIRSGDLTLGGPGAGAGSGGGDFHMHGDINIANTASKPLTGRALMQELRSAWRDNPGLRPASV